jgi:protease-4
MQSDPTPTDPSRRQASSAAPAVRAEAARSPAPPVPTTRIVLEQSGGLARKVLLWSLCMALAISVLFNFSLFAKYQSYFQTNPSLEERFHSGNAEAETKVAVISVDGAILDGEGFVKSQVDQVREDEDVAAVVLRIESPGGLVSATDQIYHRLKKLAEEREIPLVVSIGGMAASGGYYVAMAVGDTPDVIYAEPTSWTGSIGVIIPHYDLSRLLAEWNVENDSIKSHPWKNIGSMTREMTDEERALLQELVDDGFERFKTVIKSGRPKFREDEAALVEIATGQVFTTEQAIANGLVDREGFLEDAVQRARELAGLSEYQARVVEYRRPPGLSDLLGVPTVSKDSSAVAHLLELSTPRAYYMWTWLPPLATAATTR